MELSVRPRSVDWNDELQHLVERSIAFAVDRYSSQIRHIAVYLTDVNGPRGGVDKLCQITADLKTGMPVLILEKGDDMAATFHRAVRRLSYRIGRTIQRPKTARTRRPRGQTDAGAFHLNASVAS
ncbi:MAG: hypothetical protein IT168_02185 [Bryobacterales bacterium]|nr:hypothetical protein [Bryobacterales bacterium]